mmetsp:Transcript_2868/g.8494  ORF Transcript_2868/g.8494 Transcript_2868/m.8494 type:complete len:318 (+) Transcript_2868:723-1676(+)
MSRMTRSASRSAIVTGDSATGRSGSSLLSTATFWRQYLRTTAPAASASSFANAAYSSGTAEAICSRAVSACARSTGVCVRARLLVRGVALARTAFCVAAALAYRRALCVQLQEQEARQREARLRRRRRALSCEVDRERTAVTARAAETLRQLREPRGTRAAAAANRGLRSREDDPTPSDPPRRDDAVVDEEPRTRRAAPGRRHADGLAVRALPPDAPGGRGGCLATRRVLHRVESRHGQRVSVAAVRLRPRRPRARAGSCCPHRRHDDARLLVGGGGDGARRGVRSKSAPARRRHGAVARAAPYHRFQSAGHQQSHV